MEISERMLVLQVGKFREIDLWVRLLSPTRGLISAFAFGGSRSRKRFVGCLDAFNEIQVRMVPTNRGAYLVMQESVLIKGLSRLRRDWSRFGLAVNCVRFMQSFGVGQDEGAAAYFLLHETLALMEENDSIPHLLPLFFRSRLVFDHGYSLQEENCRHCGRELKNLEASILVREGVILCPNCAPSNPGACLALGPRIMQCIESVRTMPPREWGAIMLSAQDSRAFARIMDEFIRFHVGISWQNGRFIRH